MTPGTDETAASATAIRDALIVGSLIAPDGAAAYMAAMCHWGWVERLPDPVVFITPKRYVAMHHELLGLRYDLMLTRPDRLFGVVREAHAGLPLRVTDRERTVVDMMDRTDLCGGIVVVAGVLRRAWPGIDTERLTQHVGRFGGGTVPKRLGYLVEGLGLEPVGGEWTERWRGSIAPGYSVLERGGPSTGSYVRRWMVRVNATGWETERRDGGS
jgi:predicted transcriptional regulator of viral defense system